MGKKKIGMFTEYKDKSPKIDIPTPKQSVENNEDIKRKFSNIDKNTSQEKTVSNFKTKNTNNSLSNTKKSLGIKADVWVKVIALQQTFATGGANNVNTLLDELIDERYESLSPHYRELFDDKVKVLTEIELQKINLKNS